METLIYIFSRQQGKFKSNKEDDRKSGSSPLKVNKNLFFKIQVKGTYKTREDFTDIYGLHINQIMFLPLSP